jgi:hypothetical protein
MAKMRSRTISPPFPLLSIDCARKMKLEDNIGESFPETAICGDPMLTVTVNVCKEMDDDDIIRYYFYIYIFL